MVNPTSNLHIKFGNFIVAVLLVLAGTRLVHAQDAETRKHFMHDLGGPFIIYRVRVQAELKLTDDQKQSLQREQPKYVQETANIEEKLKDSQSEEREQAMQSYRAESAEKFWSLLKEVLRGNQLKRFHQLELQHEGPPGLFRPEIAKALKITDQERQRFVAVIQDMQRQMAPLIKEAQSGGNPHEILPKVIKIIEAHERTIEAGLDPSQRDQWQKIRGEPFDTLTD